MMIDHSIVACIVLWIRRSVVSSYNDEELPLLLLLLVLLSWLRSSVVCALSIGDLGRERKGGQ